MRRSRTRWVRRTGLLPVFLAFSLPVVPPATAQVMTGWSDTQQAKRLEQFARLTPGEVAKLVTTADDDLESVATLTTDRVFKTPGGFSDRVRADNFLRALIDFPALRPASLHGGATAVQRRQLPAGWHHRQQTADDQPRHRRLPLWRLHA